MNSLSLAILSLLTISIAPSAFAQKQDVAKEKPTQIAMASGEGGTNGGGADGMIRSAIKWTADLSTNLDQVKEEANKHWEDGGEELAMKTFNEGVEKAVASASSADQRIGLSYKNVDRLLELMTRLDSVHASAVAKKAIYEMYFDILKKNVNFDRTIYVAYAAGSKKIKWNADQLAQGLKDYSREFLTLSHQILTFGPKQAPYPNYSAEVYMITMSAILQGLAQDLGPIASESSTHFTEIKDALDGVAAGNMSQRDALVKIADSISKLKEGN